MFENWEHQLRALLITLDLASEPSSFIGSFNILVYTSISRGACGCFILDEPFLGGIEKILCCFIKIENCYAVPYNICCCFSYRKSGSLGLSRHQMRNQMTRKRRRSLKHLNQSQLKVKPRRAYLLLLRHQRCPRVLHPECHRGCHQVCLCVEIWTHGAWASLSICLDVSWPRKGS